MKARLMRSALCVTSVALLAGLALAAEPGYADRGSAQSDPKSAANPNSSPYSSPGQSSSSNSSSSSSTAGEMLDDTMITSKVKAAFVKDDTVSAMRISVTSTNGIVQLSGFANSPQEVARAAEVASTVPGVKQVQNEIMLKQSPDTTGTEPSPSYTR